MATITKPAISLYPYYDSISYATTGSYMVFIPGGGNSLRVRPCARYDSSNSTYTYFLTFGQDCSNNAVHLAYDLSTALTLSDFYDLGWDSTLDSSHYNGYGVEIKRDDSGHFYYVDWESLVDCNASTSMHCQNLDSSLNGFVVNGLPLQSSVEFEYEESSVSPDNPNDSSNSSLESAIYTAAAVPIVLCFFFVIYKMFMRLRG